MEKFTHLNLHTEYSIHDGLIRINELAEKAEELNFESIAISDLSNLFGYIKFYKALRKKGIKPICGSDMTLSGQNTEPGNIQFIAKNSEGYKNLIRLISIANTEGKSKGDPIIDIHSLEKFSSNLIAISGGLDSQIGKSIVSGKDDIASKQIKYLREIYKDNFFLQISRTGRNQEELCNQGLIAIAHELSVPIVATNQVRFLNKDDFEAHETRVCIQSGYVLGDQRRARDFQESQFLNPQKK